MGLEVVVAGLSAITGAIGTILQTNAASRAASAEREARDIQAAQTEIESGESRRQRIREERIRRHQILAAAENQGTTGSSGVAGAVSSLNTNLATLVSSSSGQSAANRGINRNLQRAADFTSRANTIGAWTNTIQQGIGGFQTIFDQE